MGSCALVSWSEISLFTSHGSSESTYIFTSGRNQTKEMSIRNWMLPHGSDMHHFYSHFIGQTHHMCTSTSSRWADGDVPGARGSEGLNTHQWKDCPPCLSPAPLLGQSVHVQLSSLPKRMHSYLWPVRSPDQMPYFSIKHVLPVRKLLPYSYPFF